MKPSDIKSDLETLRADLDQALLQAHQLLTVSRGGGVPDVEEFEEVATSIGEARWALANVEHTVRLEAEARPSTRAARRGR